MEKKIAFYFLLLLIFLSGRNIAQTAAQTQNDLKIILIRHAEKPEKGGNLTCKGLNRSLQLPGVIHQKFGIPDFTYIPSLKMGEKTSHARMFETVIPLAVKYNLTINSKFDEKDIAGLAADIKAHKGTVLVIWEHSVIAGIVQALGITDNINWPGDDYESIWIITFLNGKPTLSKDKEGLSPSDECPG